MTQVQVAPVDQDAFVAWVQPALTSMTRLAGRIAYTCDPQEVAADAVERAWRERARYDPRRGTPRTWLLTIAASVAQDAHRRAVRRQGLLRRLPLVPESFYIARDLDLDHAVRALPAQQRLAVNCFYYLDLPVEEIAQVMGCSPSTVRSTLNHARKTLRTSLGDDHVS